MRDKNRKGHAFPRTNRKGKAIMGQEGEEKFSPDVDPQRVSKGEKRKNRIADTKKANGSRKKLRDREKRRGKERDPYRYPKKRARFCRESR